MIYEAINTKFNIEMLKQHLEEHVLALEPIHQSPAFGGWSVLSSDKTYKDGWHPGHRVVQKDISVEKLSALVGAMGGKKRSEYVLPTEICHGYLAEVIEEIKNMGFHPQRARLIKLTAGLESTWHRDYPDHVDAVRLHLPIITNDKCFFEIEGDRAHMAATGQSYLVRVNRLHRVVNGGTYDRVHLVMDVVDHKKISQFHQPKA